MLRQVAPEILDQLPPDDPAAVASRRDLRRLNLAMGNPSWFRRQLLPRLRPDDRVLEFGAGDGSLRADLSCPVPWDALDLAPRPASWPAEALWHQGDVRHFDGWHHYTVLIGNLVFHHLEADELGHVGRAARHQVRLILASEPARQRWVRALYACLGPIFNLHAVTRHDGRVSITAGFRRTELADALQLPAAQWQCQHTITARGAYRLIAEHRP